jgi:hypothetical protein
LFIRETGFRESKRGSKSDDQNQGLWWDRVDPDLEVYQQAEPVELNAQQVAPAEPDKVVFVNELIKKSFSYYQAAFTAFLREKEGKVKEHEKNVAEE